jgi:hypothetical protein
VLARWEDTIQLSGDPRPQYAGTAFSLLTTFPNKELVEEGQTLEVQCALCSVLCSAVQRLTGGWYRSIDFSPGYVPDQLQPGLTLALASSDYL